MCRNQLGRRNVTKEQRDYLIKEEHDALLKTHGILDGFHENQYLKTGLGENRQGASDKKTFQARKVIAKERGITESAVRESVEFGRGLDAAEKIAPGFRGAVLSGASKDGNPVDSEHPRSQDSRRRRSHQIRRHWHGKGDHPAEQTGTAA